MKNLHRRTSVLCIRSGPRTEDAYDIANQRNSGSDERDAKPVDPAQHKQSRKHYKTNRQQISRPEQQLRVVKRQEAVDQAEENGPHAMACIETHPGAPHGGLFCNDGMNALHRRL